MKHNAPKKRTLGSGSRRCKLCGRFGAHVSKYKIHFCRHCFKERATEIGFSRYS